MMPGWGPAEPPEPTIEGLLYEVMELRKKLESEKLRCDEVYKAGCKLAETIMKERDALRLELEEALKCSSCTSTLGVQSYCPECYTDV